MGKRDERFVRSLLAGLTLKDAAREAGVPEERARSFLESVASFAGSVGSTHAFGSPEQDHDAGEARGADPRPAYPELIVYTDGASRGNPGPSGAGGVLLAPNGDTVEEFREHLGSTTNNVAEYEAVRIGLTKALGHGARRVTLRMDSELVANQLAGRYRVKDPKLIDRYLQVERLLSQLDEITFETIPRGENSRADRLAQMGAGVKP